jgi:streptogramin lyase
MNRSSLTRFAALSALGCTLILTGCAGIVAFPDTSTDSPTAMGSIQGSNYGGHAPIVGAHVFVLEGYTSSSGYNQPSKSLLSASYSGNYPTAKEPAGTAVTGDYYVTTDVHGYFGVSGDYTCDPGYPVYIYAEGGNPQTIPSVSLTGFSITSNVVTFTNSGTSLLYQGESITVAGVPSAYSYLNGTYTVSSTGLTISSFQVALTNANVASTTLSSGTASQFSAANNPAIVNLAMLGNCPTSGSANFSYLNFVYMNEVSTVAAAYALGGFFPTPGTTGLAVAGASAANLSIPASDSLALTGLQNAALTAAQLYDIQGGNQGTGGDGETHIARTTTPVGNGTVPQALINTLGNILANCVDSANTSIVTANESTQCSTLFADTLSAGTSGTRPIDTASSAIDMANNPWANASALATSPTGNAPFQPIITGANDLSIGIRFAPANINEPQGIAIDGSGNIWYTNFGSGYVTTLSPLGSVVYNVANSGDELGYIAIDGNGTAWYGDVSKYSLSRISNAGTYISTYDTGNLGFPYGIAVDGSYGTGYIYIANANVPSVDRFDGNGALSGTNPLAGASSCEGTYRADHIATDNSNNGFNVWISSEQGDEICEVNSSGALVRKVVVNSGQGAGNTYSPEFIAIDSYGSVWIPDQINNTMEKVVQSGTHTEPSGGTLSSPFGSAVDGDGNVFITNRNSNSITEYLGSTSAAVSATNFEGAGNASMLSDPLNIAIDPSGNVWTTNYSGSKIVEMVGLAAPTYTPLSSASYVNKLGSRP